MGLCEPSNLLWQEITHPMSLIAIPTCSDDDSTRGSHDIVLSIIFGIGDCVSHKTVLPSLISAVQFSYMLRRKSNAIRNYAKIVRADLLTFCLLD